MRYSFTCDFKQDDEQGNFRKVFAASGHILTLDDKHSDAVERAVTGVFGAAIDYIQEQ